MVEGKTYLPWLMNWCVQRLIIGYKYSRNGLLLCWLNISVDHRKQDCKRQTRCSRARSAAVSQGKPPVVVWCLLM